MAFRGVDTTYDESEQVVDRIIQYREGMDMFMTDFVGKQKELIHDMGGLNPRIYDVHAKMIILNEVCEKFLRGEGEDLDEAAQTELNQAITQESLYSMETSDDLEESLTLFPH